MPLVARNHALSPPRRRARPTADLVLRAPLDEAAIDDVCERVRALLGGGEGEVVCDVAGLTDAGLGAVVVLARLQLTARRLGGSIRVRNAATRLHDVLWLVGLCDVVGPCAPLLLEAGGKAEEWEEPGGVEEERDSADPIA